MKKVFSQGDAKKELSNRIALKGGSYSLLITTVVIAILVVCNVLASVLPAAWTSYDISSSKLYSITSNTKAVVNALQDDVTIYWIVQDGEEDEVMNNLLSKYDSLSDHIEIVKKNPDIYPTFAEQYTTEEVANNSLVVECGERSRFIGYDDIYLSQPDMTTGYYDVSFDGEGAITSAIDYVVNAQQPMIYVLEGHGEAQLPETFSKQLEKENMELTQFSLLTVDAVPEEADCVLIYAPTSDISEEEKNMLQTYVESGGKMMVMAGPTEDGTLTTLYSLLAEYGVEPAEGIVVEEDRAHYAFGAPYILMPDMGESEITTPLLDERYYAIMPIAQGLTVSETASDVTALLTTSALSFSKIAGYGLETYEKEEGDIDGPFAVAVSVDCGNEGQLVWFSSSSFLDEEFNAYSSGGNLDLTMNAMSSLVGESEAVAIRSKSLNYNYLTIDDSTASYLKTVMIGVFPLAYLGIGIFVILRRKKKNETN